MIIQALKELLPGNEWSVNGDFGDEDFQIICNTKAITIPSKEVIEAKVAELTLIGAKNIQKGMIDLSFEKMKSAPISHMNFVFSCDTSARLSLINAILTLDDIASLQWLTADNNIVTVKKNDIFDISIAIRDRDIDFHLKVKAAKDLIDTLDNIADIQNIQLK